MYTSYDTSPYTYDTSFLCEYITRDRRCAGPPSVPPLLSTQAPLPRVFVDPSLYPLTVLRRGKWFPGPDTHVQRPAPGLPKTTSRVCSHSPPSGMRGHGKNAGAGHRRPPPTPHHTWQDARVPPLSFQGRGDGRAMSDGLQASLPRCAHQEKDTRMGDQGI